MSDKPELKPCPFCCDMNVYLGKDFRNGEDIIKTSHTGCEAEVWFYGNSSEIRQKVIAAWNQRADLAKPSEWISVDMPPVYVLGFSVARKGWCIFTEDIKGVTMEYWAGPFSEQCVAESEIKRLAERTP